MASEPDRYAALKRSHEQPAPGTAEQVVSAMHETRDTVAELAGEEPTRPVDGPHKSPGWTDRGDMPAQQTSALAWVKASHELRQDQVSGSQQEPEQRRLSFFEDKGRNYGELKSE